MHYSTSTPSRITITLPYWPPPPVRLRSRWYGYYPQDKAERMAHYQQSLDPVVPRVGFTYRPPLPVQTRRERPLRQSSPRAPQRLHAHQRARAAHRRQSPRPRTRLKFS